MASSLALTQAELLKVGPISSRNSLRLLPISKKKKKQKFVIGDEYGVVSSFQMKKGEPQSVYKTNALGNPISCVQMGTSRGYEDKAFVSTGQSVYGYTKKGKEIFKFQSNMAEPINKIQVYENKLWTATDFVYNQYEDGEDSNFYMSPDKINDMIVMLSTETNEMISFLACQDRHVRVIKGSNVITKKSVHSPVMALCKMPVRVVGAPCQILYATANGGIGLLQFSGEKIKTKWKSTNLPGGTACINSIACYDINGDDRLEVLLGRDDGSIEVLAMEENGEEITPLFHHVSTDSVRCVQGGIISTPGFDEVVVCTFSGRLLSFTTEPLDQLDTEDAHGRSRGTVLRETRIVKLRKEIALLEEKLGREREKGKNAKEKEYLPPVDEFVVNSRFALNPAIGAYEVSLEIPVNIHSVCLHSAVPVELLDNDKNHAIVSKSPADPANNTHFLATYRCLEPTHRLEFSLRTIEGQAGEIEAIVLTEGARKSAQAVRFLIKPLSLHHRVNELDEKELQTPMNALQFTGSFSLAQVHEWVSLCLPEVPARLQEEDVTMYFKNSFLGDALVCRYRKGEASFSSPSVSVIAIMKEVITREATARKVLINISLDIKNETTPVMLQYLKPFLDAKHALASQVKVIDGLKELEMHETDYKEWMAPEYQDILGQAERIQADFKTSPKALHYLAGILTDLYVDLCKFQGTNVSEWKNGQENHQSEVLTDAALTVVMGTFVQAKQNLPRLYQLIEHYHYDSLVDFFVRN